MTNADFGAAVAALTPDLYRFARKLAGDRHGADDLVQETVARALQARDTFRGDASLTTWLHRIMWNLSVDRARRSGRELLVDEVEGRWRDDAYTVDPAVVAQRAADTEQLREALVRLPFIYRSAVVLSDSLGWTSAEIADRLGITVANAKQRVHRGRMLLITALAEGPARRHALKGVTMQCWDARRHVSDYLDGQLDVGRAANLESHLAACPTCPPLYAALVDNRSVMSSLRDGDDTLPPDLVARVRHAVDTSISRSAT